MKQLSVKRRALLVAAILALVVAVCFFWQSGIFTPAPDPIPAPSSSAVSSAPPASSEPTESSATSSDDGLPHDRLFITMERHNYENGTLRLYIPRLSIDTPLLGDGTTEADLDKGVCLYEYAQLPGEGNRNTSFTGHRDSIHKSKEIFYDVDKLVDGDYFYLADADTIYRYLFESSFVIEPDNWGPIYSQGYSCLTLVTCTPPRTATHRLVVRAKLDEIVPYSEDYVFAADNRGGEPVA